MAPPESGRTVFDVGSEIAGAIIRNVEMEMRMLMGIKPCLPTLFGWGESTYLSEGYILEWLRDEAKSHRVQLTAPFAAATDTTLTLEDSNLVMDTQLLFFENQVFRVLSHVDDTVVNVTKAYQGSTAADIASGEYLFIGLPDSLDDDSFALDTWQRGEVLTNTPLHVVKKWGGTDLRTSLRGYLDQGENPIDRETMKKRQELEKQLEMSMIYGRGVTPTGTTPGHFKGVRQLITTHLTALNDEPLTGFVLGDLFEEMAMDDEDQMGKTVVGGMTMKRAWNAMWRSEFDRQGEVTTNEVGLKVDRIYTDWGEFDYYLCRAMPAGELWIVNASDVRLRPVNTQAGSGWMEYEWKAEQLQKRQREIGMTNVFTLQVDNERRHGRITGISEDLGLYGGVI